MKPKNKIRGQWSPRPIEMLVSPAYRVLSLSAHRVISRLEIELARHHGNDNGKLPVTKQDFIDYGLSARLVAAAIREAEALGFIRVTEHGRGGNAEHRHPNKFFLTFVNGIGSSPPPTHDWRKIKTLEDAKAIAETARGARDANAVAFGRRNWRIRKNRNRYHKVVQAPVPQSGTENSNFRYHKVIPRGGQSPGPQSGTTVYTSLERSDISPRSAAAMVPVPEPAGAKLPGSTPTLIEVVDVPRASPGDAGSDGGPVSHAPCPVASDAERSGLMAHVAEVIACELDRLDAAAALVPGDLPILCRWHRRNEASLLEAGLSAAEAGTMAHEFLEARLAEFMPPQLAWTGHARSCMMRAAVTLTMWIICIHLAKLL